MASRSPGRTPARIPQTVSLPWVIAIVAMIGAIGLAVWTTSLRTDLSDARNEIDALTEERDQLREASTAQVFDLTPTAQGPANGSGALYLTASGSGVLSAANLPELEDSQAYQVWFLPPDEGEPIPGGTFSVDERGVGFMLVSADVGAIRGISISVEPEDGSTEPTGPMLLSGSATGARG